MSSPDVTSGRRVLGRPRPDEPRAHDRPRLRASSTGSATSPTCGWRPASRAGYRALGEPLGVIFPFLDSDVYKWLEAVGWELGRAPDAELARKADEVDRARRGRPATRRLPQQLRPGRRRRRDRTATWPGATSCTASATWSRRRSPGIARSATTGCSTSRCAPWTRSTASSARADGTPSTAIPRSRWRSSSSTARRAIGGTSTSPRGSSTCAVTGCSGPVGSDRRYWQDHVPVREAPTVAGHAVRQLYLDCGAVDVAVELGDQALLDAVLRRWRDMVATRTYLTGGARQPPQRRGLRRPVRAAARTGRTRRPARRSPA